MGHRIKAQLSVDTERQLLAVKTTVQLAGRLAAPDQIMNELKIASAFLRVMHLGRHFTGAAEAGAEANPLKLGLVLKNLNQLGQNLHKLFCYRPPPFSARFLRAKSLLW